MDSAIKKAVERQFPEIKSGYHLPIFGRVESVRENPDQGDIADPFRPYYGVDVKILDEHGETNEAIPLLRDVPLCLPVCGSEMGHFAYPEDGAVVEIAFAYGSPNHPFIRGILAKNLSLPKIERGEQLWQHNPESYHRVDKEGSWERKTDLDITETSRKRTVTAAEKISTLNSETKDVQGDSTTTIGAMSRLKAFGGVECLSGGRYDLGALDDLNLSSNTKILSKAPKTWLGSDAENVLGILSELMQLLIDLCDVLDSHTHPTVGAITQAAQVAQVGTDTGAVKARLDGIKE